MVYVVLLGGQEPSIGLYQAATDHHRLQNGPWNYLEGTSSFQKQTISNF